MHAQRRRCPYTGVQSTSELHKSRPVKLLTRSSPRRANNGTHLRVYQAESACHLVSPQNLALTNTDLILPTQRTSFPAFRHQHLLQLLFSGCQKLLTMMLPLIGQKERLRVRGRGSEIGRGLQEGRDPRDRCRTADAPFSDVAEGSWDVGEESRTDG